MKWEVYTGTAKMSEMGETFLGWSPRNNEWVPLVQVSVGEAFLFNGDRFDMEDITHVMKVEAPEVSE